MRRLGRNVAALDQLGVSLDDFKRRLLALAPEADVDLVLADAKITHRQVREPCRKERIDVLQKLGFIQVMPVGSKKHGYILLPDPHKVIKKLKADGRVSASWWGAYVKRASEIGYVIP